MTNPGGGEGAGQAGTKRIVALDGLRAVAVITVFIHHATSIQLWMGVDLFFVMSGFLITGILLERKKRGQSYFAHFYARRARRILPPYVLLLAVSSLLFGCQWAAHWPWFLFFAANIGMSIGTIGHGSLTPLWSLAVEEQFYLVWPFVVLLVTESTLMWVSAGLIVLAPVLRAACTHLFTSYVPIYFLTPFRMDLLAAGALMAVVARRGRGALGGFLPAARIGAGVAVALHIALNVAISHPRDANLPFTNAVLYSNTLLFSACFVLIAIEDKGVVHRMLVHPWLVFLGRISYTMYLIHLTVLNMLWRSHLPAVACLVLGSAITVVYASISWVLMENPLLDGGYRPRADGELIRTAVN